MFITTTLTTGDVTEYNLAAYFISKTNILNTTCWTEFIVKCLVSFYYS